MFFVNSFVPHSLSKLKISQLSNLNQIMMFIYFCQLSVRLRRLKNLSLVWKELLFLSYHHVEKRKEKIIKMSRQIMKPGEKYVCCYQCSNLWLYARKVEPLIQQIETRINLPLLQLVRMANTQRQALKIARNFVAVWHDASFYLILLTADIRWRLLTGLKMTLNQGMKSFSYLNKNCSAKQDEYLKTRKICFFVI